MFSHYFNPIYICRRIFPIHEIQTVIFQSLFHALGWKKETTFPEADVFSHLLDERCFAHLLPGKQRRFKRGHSFSELEEEGSFEEEQTTNKLHGHYPLCILVLIGVADSCLLIRKGSRKTHKFSQGSQTA